MDKKDVVCKSITLPIVANQPTKALAVAVLVFTLVLFVHPARGLFSYLIKK